MFYFKIVVVLFMIGFLSFISKTNCTALICLRLVCSLICYFIHVLLSGVGLGVTGVVYSRKATYLDSPCVQCGLN